MGPSAIPHVVLALAYVRDVVEGRRPACKWERAACQRHLDDLESAKRADWLYRFDALKGERVCKFIELLPHVKGKWARKDPKTGRAQRLRLEGWQCFIVCMLFGWVKKATGTRRFIKASLYIPRKNAKSTLAAGIGHWMAWKDGEPGAEVYSGATSLKQALEVFTAAWQMVKREEQMRDGLGIEVTGKTEPGPLIRMEDGSRFEPIIGNPGDGASPHCAIIDEYHEHPTSDLHDTMITGMGAREQPLALIISTAGTNLAGPCREDWKTCEKILGRAPGFDDETHFAVIFTIDDGDDWASEAALRKANPNFDVSVSRDFLNAQLAKAKRDPRAQSIFKTKHLNLWTAAKEAFFDVEEWRACRFDGLSLEQVKGGTCVIGLDVAPIRDFSALVAAIAYEGKWAIFGRYYTTRKVVDQPHNQHLRAWETAGYLHAFDGNAQDLEKVAEETVDFYRLTGATELAFDSAHAHMLVSTLMRQGVNAVDAYAGAGAKIPEFVAEFQQAMARGKIIHDGNPVLEWAISNCISKPAKRGMVFLGRESEDKKIDPAVAAVMALGRAMAAPVQQSAGGFAFA